MKRSSLKRKSPLKARRRKCKLASCRSWFEPKRSNQAVCSPECALQYAREQRVKEVHGLPARRKRRPIDTAAESARRAVHSWVLWRDRKLGCVSCEKGPSWGGVWHASHYRPAGNNSALRYDPRNIHKACSECNLHKSGNLTAYRIELVGRVGEPEVLWLEGPHPVKLWMVEELQAIGREFRQMLREAKRAIE